MVFSSLLFVFAFLCLNIIVYYMARTIQQRNMILLCFSILFYSWGGPQYLLLLLGMTFCSWLCARRIESSDEKQKRKKWLILECVVLLGLLGIFKYTGFFLSNLQLLTGVPKEIPTIVLPIGISFYTFQLLSYVVDVYRREVSAQPAYWKLLLYSSLFHQCIAGPIVRYQTVAEEIDSRKVSTFDMAAGIRRFSVGLAKKAILANACSAAADELLANPSIQTGAGLWLGMLFYMLFIYLDFSAYSDMAIGLGRMVGFHYLENFNYPYIASCVQDFWRRWHISLSSFFRDYVYIPLGGSRKGSLCTIRNLIAVWFLTGMWHGASWNYILWGLYFLVFLLLERFLLKRLLEKLPRLIRTGYTLLVVYFGWILFRFEDLSEVLVVLKGMFGAGDSGWTNLPTLYIFLNNLFLLIFCIIAVTPLGKKLRNGIYRRAGEQQKIPRGMMILDAVLPAVLLVLSTLALVGNSYDPFLYFRF